MATTTKNKTVAGNTYSNGNPALDVYTNHGSDGAATATVSKAALPSNNSTTVKTTTPTTTKDKTTTTAAKTTTGLPSSGSTGTTPTATTAKASTPSTASATSSAVGSPTWTNTELQKIYQNIGKNDYVPGEFSNPELQRIVDESTVKDDAYYTQRATDQYTPQYNKDVQSVNQAERAQNLAYNRQEQQTTSAYQKSLDTANANKVTTMANVRNSAIRRGMGRSSYALQTEAETEAALDKSINDLSTEYMNDINYIGELRANLTKDTQEKLATLATNLEIAIREGAEALRDKDVDRRNTALSNLGNARANWNNMVEQVKADNARNNNSTTLSVLSMIADNNDRAYAREQAAKASTGSGGGGSASTAPVSTAPTITSGNTVSPTVDFNSWYNSLASTKGSGVKSKDETENNGNIYTAAHQYAEERMRRGY